MTDTMQKNEKNQRKLCFDILLRYENEKAFLNLLLKEVLNDSDDYGGFVTQIVYGTVRYRRRLDFVIQKYSSVKLKKICIPVLTILRMGIYQMYFMDSVPDFAVINESVKLCGRVSYKSKGFVNAILRKCALREKTDMPIKIKYSFSDEMFEKIKGQYGEKTEEILVALNKNKPACIRVNRLKSTEEKPKNCTEKDGFFFAEGKIDSKLYTEGKITVQSMSSQLSVRVLAPKKGENVIDMCCAPGGKTALIAEFMKNTGEITGFELHPHRAGLTRKNLERLGVKNAEIFVSDSTVFKKELENTADRVLCDVPCSGWGTIPNKPDVKWQEIDTNELVKIQKSILENAGKYLKKGGILVYSTCTVNKEENEYIIEDFLKKNKNFVLCPFEEKGIKSDGMLQILPDETKIGFFIAKMKKI